MVLLVITVAVYSAATLLFCYTTKPEVTEGDFPFSITYEYKGGTRNPFGCDEMRLFRLPYDYPGSLQVLGCRSDIRQPEKYGNITIKSKLEQLSSGTAVLSCAAGFWGGVAPVCEWLFVQLCATAVNDTFIAAVERTICIDSKKESTSPSTVSDI